MQSIGTLVGRQGVGLPPIQIAQLGALDPVRGAPDRLPKIGTVVRFVQGGIIIGEA